MAPEAEDAEGLKCPGGALGLSVGAGDPALQWLVLPIPKPGADPQEWGCRWVLGWNLAGDGQAGVASPVRPA